MPGEEGQLLQEVISTKAAVADEFIRFWAEGERAKGEFHCAECGYGVIIHTTLPVCPMCSSTSWEQSAWSPFKRRGPHGSPTDSLLRS